MSPPPELLHAVARQFALAHPRDTAGVVNRLSTARAAALIGTLPEPAAVSVMRQVNQDHAAAILDMLPHGPANALLGGLDPVRSAGLLARLEESQREAHLERLNPSVARDLREVLSFPQGTAGWLMDARIATFTESATVASVLDGIRQARGGRITDVLVADVDGIFAGVVALQRLVSAPPDQRIAALVERDAPTVQPMAGYAEVRQTLDHFRVASLPVVGLHGKILGVIRHAALVTAAEEAMGGSLQQMVGASAEERALGSPWASVKSRLPWLQINLLTAFLASAVVSLFDATIAQFTALAVLMPVVAGQSGNTGAQALAVVSRGLALREIRISQVGPVLLKEFAAALINGSAVAIVTAGGVWLWSQNTGLALVIGISMILSMVLAALAGGAIPILLTAAGRDPATASSIVLTTVTDICGFFSFLGLATVLSAWLAAG